MNQELEAILKAYDAVQEKASGEQADDVDVPVVEDELDELHAASTIDAMTRGTARPAVCLSCM